MRSTRTASGELLISVSVGEETGTRRIARPQEKKTSRTPALLMGGAALVALIAMAALAIVGTTGSQKPNQPDPSADDANGATAVENAPPRNPGRVARERVTALLASFKRGEISTPAALGRAIAEAKPHTNAATLPLLAQELQALANRLRAAQGAPGSRETLTDYERNLARFCIALATHNAELHEAAFPALLAFSAYVADPSLALETAEALGVVATESAGLAVAAMRERFGLRDDRWKAIEPGFMRAFAHALTAEQLDPVGARQRHLAALRAAIAERLETDDVDGALALADAARIEAPDDPEIILLRAGIHFSRNAFDAAGAVCQSVLEIESTHAGALILLGRIALAQDKPRQAFADLTAAIDGAEADESVLEAYHHRAIALRALNEYESAIDDLNVYLAARPDDLDALVLRARSYIALRENDAALADLNTVIEADDQHADAYYRRGYVHYSLGDVQAALDDFTAVIAIEPDHIHAIVNRGVTRRQLDDVDGAMADYNAALVIDPNNASALNNRGNLYLELDEADNAIADYAAALEQEPRSALYHTNYADALAAVDRNDDAIDEYSVALQLANNYTRALKGRGQVYIKLGRYLEARTDLEVLAVARTSDYEVWIALGTAQYHLDALDHARRAFEFALRHAPAEAQQEVLDARRALLGE